MSTPLWICDSCLGPAVWTFFDGEPWYHCEGECDGFRQLELFEEKRVSTPMESDAAGRTGMRQKEGDHELPF
jgi:hypothetical protein